ncbi:MAG: sigma-70 family RNA polymerase sigma factor [Chloroflexi bacterium]|nr:sigma-70 family RNA polymerase sigma factor [Chloroflexota bacterium]
MARAAASARSRAIRFVGAGHPGQQLPSGPGRRRRLVREIAVSDPGEVIATSADPEDAPDDRAAAVDSLERAFERLPAADRTILVLHHLEQLPLNEIAATLAIPVGTAKSRLSAARRLLKRAWEAEQR